MFFLLPPTRKLRQWFSIYFLVITAGYGQFYDTRWVSWTLVKVFVEYVQFFKGISDGAYLL